MNPDSRKIRLILHLRHNGITDSKVLGAIERVPRDIFVPEAFRDQAYEDVALPIGYQQTVSQPTVVARMTEALDLGPRMKVLEVGTGSGYQTTVLAALCRRVYTVERHRPLLAEAERRLADLRITNVTAAARDGLKGWPEQAPFDRILVTAAAAAVPDALAEQITIGGILVLPIGPYDGDQEILKIIRTDEGYETERLGPVRFVPIVPGLADAVPTKG